ncbi:MAG: hypothetical protein RLP15_00160 [Cryomorphaceae bacterium]
MKLPLHINSAIRIALRLSSVLALYCLLLPMEGAAQQIKALRHEGTYHYSRNDKDLTKKEVRRALKSVHSSKAALGRMRGLKVLVPLISISGVYLIGYEFTRYPSGEHPQFKGLLFGSGVLGAAVGLHAYTEMLFLEAIEIYNAHQIDLHVPQ